MTSKNLPDELREFVMAHVDSITHLEALLLLLRGAGVALAVSVVADRLYVDEQTARDVLARLNAMGVAIHVDGAYRYGADAGLDRLIRMLARQYAENLISITSLVHAK